MSDEWDDNDNTDTSNSGGGLRKQLEDALASKKAAEQRAAKAESALAVRNVATSLKEKGYRESAAKWASRDGVDVSDAKALDAWLASDGAEFKLPDSEHTQDDNAQVDTPDPDAPEGAEQVSAAVTNLRSVANSPSAVALERAMKALPDDADEDTVYRALAGTGV